MTTGAEGGRTIKIGVVSPATGVLAQFGLVDDWWVKHARDAVSNGVVGSDGKNHPVEVLVEDSQSDSNRSAQVTGDLITNQTCDIILASGSPDTVNPSADQCEALGTPFLGNLSPWQAFYFERQPPEDGFTWTYGFFLGAEQAMNCFVDVFSKIPNNKMVGCLFANDADAHGWLNEETGIPAVLDAAGYTMVLPSLYQPGAEEFTAQISEFRKKGCEILCGTNNTAEFTNFWKQSLQQGFHPKIATTGKAIGTPASLDAIGEAAYGLIADAPWHATWPFKDSLTGMTCQEIAEDYETKMNQQWTPVIVQYAKFEWAMDVMKRAADIDDKQSVLAAIKATKMETIGGPIDFTEPIDPAGKHPNPNVYKPPYVAVQWQKGTERMFDALIISNAEAPMVTVQAEPVAMQYS